MKVTAAAAVLLAVLSGCAAPADPDNAAGVALENVAIARGVVRDPAANALPGLYARDDDRVCVVAAGEGRYRVGVTSDYGGKGCSAAGLASGAGGQLSVRFPRAPGCDFDIAVEGDRIDFPGTLPAACAALCSGRISFAGLGADRMSDAASEAADARDRRGRPLCGS